ncbi:cytochrome c [Nitrosomonas sp. Is37]|uniref:cytochrome c n=1 Tax=Nitrosomonas sp. Is37 TaxID=3080535 RepID=UPI00294AA7A9|nr:cytochrome c [Nitrosomonas sp. Is37]
MISITSFTNIINKAPGKFARHSWIIYAVAMIAASVQAADPEMIARGAYLAKVADCESCHTAGPDHAPFSGGLPINSPFGIIYSTNITPDPTTGIGQYSYEDFSRAVREGLAKDGKRLYPAMPYPSFAAVQDSDIQALYAYFMEGVEPVPHIPPQTELPFPFNQRWTLRFWAMAFATQKPYEPRADRNEKWNRGAYLVQALGHCGACHTPRGLAYQEKAYSELSSDYLSGSEVDNWSAADLTGNLASGLGRWSEAEVSTFLETGHSRLGVAFGSMVTVIENSLQHLRKDDLDAVAHYLKSLPVGRKSRSYYKPLISQDQLILTKLEVGVNKFELPGTAVYSGFCVKCHQDNGMGKLPRIPRLSGNSMVLSENPVSIIRQVLEGGKGPLTKNGPKPKKMPSFAKKLSDREIADVLTFVRNSWGNTAPPVTPREVSILRKEVLRE